MTYVSAGQIILTLTQPVGSRLLEWGSNQRSPDDELHALPTELLPYGKKTEVSRGKRRVRRR